VLDILTSLVDHQQTSVDRDAKVNMVLAGMEAL
jgi:hypothetical protein